MIRSIHPQNFFNNNIMRTLFPLIILTVVVAACQPQTETETYPQDLEGKRQLLRTKLSALQQLTQEINQLESEIAELDPQLKARQSRVVSTLPVLRGDFNSYVEIQGSVQADESVAAAPEISGRILRLTVEEGDRVQAGQLLAEIDVEQVEKQIAELETSLELATTVFERQARLWEQNIGSEIQYLEAKNNKERLERSLETLRVQLGRSQVVAPISGVVERLNLEAGELAMAGTPILQILNTRSLLVAADLPERYLRSVHRGESVQIRYPALDMEQNARVTLIGSTIDEVNRTFKVEARVGNPQGLLKPNLLAVVLVKDQTEQDVVSLPFDLVQQEVGGRKFVYVVEDSGEYPVAKKVYVATGMDYDGNVVITRGLSGGETLITEGAIGLSDGERITITNDKTAIING